MNYFDSERNIISLLQTIPLINVYWVNATKEAQKYFFSLYLKRKFIKWVDNFGKDAPPPDFFSEKYNYMLEVMRVDDYEMGVFSPNALESKAYVRIRNMLRENRPTTFEQTGIQVLVNPDITKASKNGYAIYRENFKRIVGKHIGKIDNYRKNHPGKKLGFLIFDESPGYMQISNSDFLHEVGQQVCGRPHRYFWDKNLVGIFDNADVDFVIWITPYKNLPYNPQVFPQMCVFDIKRKIKWKKRLINYNDNEMICLEV